jgi:hypothetical protein
MARALTRNERAVLAHVVVDPDAWWDHATTWGKVDEEKALSDKIARWQPSYDDAKDDPAYETRANRLDENGEHIPARPKR